MTEMNTQLGTRKIPEGPLTTLQEYLAISQNDAENIARSLPDILVSSESISDVQKIKSRQSASGFLKGVNSNVILHTKTITRAEADSVVISSRKALSDQLTKTGLIAYYIESGSIDKPPFTQPEPFIDWDLSHETIEQIRKAINLETLNIAAEITRENRSSSVNQNNLAEIITAVAYLKVKEVIDKTKTNQTYTEDKFDK